MDNASLQKIKDAIAKSNNIGIVVGQNPTLDQMAAALSLYLLLNQVHKRAVVASPTDPIVEISSLVGINKVQTSLGGDAGDLVVSFPYVEGEIEKVSYTLENEFLNIIVKAGEKGLSFDEKDVKYVRGSGSVDLLVVVGTAKLSDLGELVSGDKLNNAKIINMDNKKDNQKYGDILLVSPTASSVSEIMGDLLLNLGFHIDQDASQNLLSGILSATNNFQDPNTTPLALEIASIVMKNGAIRPRETKASESNFAPVAQPQPEQKQEERQSFEDLVSQQNQQPAQPTQPEQPQSEDKAPIDWLSPKVYKGSSNV
jgi:hypothetical protein